MLLLLALPLLFVAATPAAPSLEAAPAACGRAEAAACHRLAERILSGAPSAELARYAPALQAGCDKKLADACAGLGLALHRGAGVPKDVARSRQLRDAACEGGSSVACASVAEEDLEGKASAEVKARALARATERCEKLGGSVCFSVASAWAAGWGVAVDEAKSASYSRRACDTGSSYACYVEAGMLLEREQEAAAPRAKPMLTRACDGDVGPACFMLSGLLVEGGGGVPVNVKQGVAYAQRACSLGEPEACDYLATSNEGRAAKPDADPGFKSEAEMLRVHRKYCDLGGAEACAVPAFELGEVAEKSGKLEAMEEVLTLLQKGCNRGSDRSCNVLGHVAKDALRACDAGQAGQCLVAGFVHLQGTAMPPINGPTLPRDEAKARAAFEKACAGGTKVACARVKAGGK